MKRFVSLLVPAAAFSLLITAACADDDEPATATTAPATITRQAGNSPAATTKGPLKLEDATTTPSGLQYRDEKAGTGPSPRMDQQVTVHYTGKLATNGQVFDSSVARGQPATFAMSGVIKGFSEGLSTMKVGGKRTVYIPAALGYGASGTPGGPIPPNADLIFEIELIAVK